MPLLAKGPSVAYPHILTGYHGGRQTSVSRIVIHATVSPCQRGGARANARYFQTHRTGSAHYVVDPAEIVLCVPEGLVAYHAPPNTGSIGIELCDPQTGPDTRWEDANHDAMLARAAVLIREVAKRWNVPLVRIGAGDLRAGRHGICGHADVSNAWHETDHTDPGSGFPWGRFMALVKGGAPEEDDVPEYISLSTTKPVKGKKGDKPSVVWDKVYAGSKKDGIIPVSPAKAVVEFSGAVPHQLYAVDEHGKERDLGGNDVSVVLLDKGDVLYARLLFDRDVPDGTTPYVKAMFWKS